jgi:hypothetical protein
MYIGHSCRYCGVPPKYNAQCPSPDDRPRIIYAKFSAFFVIFLFRAWAHPRAYGARTGLYACIFFARGKKGYRFNPLRCCKTASMPFYSYEFLRGKNS